MAWLLILIALSTSQAVYGILNSTSIIVQPDGFTVYTCMQVNHREQEIEPAMLGLWYVIEIIQHQEDPKYRGTKVSEICPKLNLFKTAPDEVKLIWTEKAGDIHYNFKMTDPENSGFWLAWGKQSGSMLNKVYQQFLGSVQVLEAQPSRMMLVFCANNRTHYTIIMVRNITVTHDTSEEHRMLANYRLPEVSVRHTCRDSAPDSSTTMSISALTVILPSIFLLVSRLN